MVRKFALVLLPALFFSACGSAEVTPVEVVDEQEVTVVEDEAVLHQADIETTSVTWFGSKVVGSSHGGTIKLKEGNLQSVDGVYVGGSFVLDMATVDSDEDNAKLEDHLKGTDFFDVAAFPEAKFEVTSLTKADEVGAYEVAGNLEIKGVSKNISFPATLAEGADTDTMTAEFAIDRSDWGIDYGLVGDNLINDEIKFTVELNVKK